MHLTICGLEYPPYLSISNGVLSGIFADFLQQVSQSLNFTYNFIDTTGQNYEIKENESFVGMILMVQRGQCHFFWGPMGISAELAEIVDYTANVDALDVVILSSAESIEKRSGAIWELLSSNPQVIGALVVIMIVFSCLLFFNERKIWKNPSRHTDFWNAVWYHFGSIFLEPFRLKPTSHATRVLIGFWWICVIILVSLIGGNLKASLSHTDSGTIDSAEDIVARSSIQPVIMAGVAYDNEFKTSKDPVLQGVYQKTLKTGGLLTYPELTEPSIVESLDKGRSVMIFLHPTISYFFSQFCTQDIHEKYYISKKEIFKMTAAFSFTKGFSSDFKEKLNQKIRYFSAMQLLVPSQRANSLRYEHCLWKPSGYQSGNNDIVLISAIWVIGMFLSGIFLLIEFVFAASTRKNDISR